MSKRCYIRILSFLIAGLLVIAVFLFNYFREAEFYKTKVKYTYSRALQEFSTSINNINLNLEKAGYVTTPKQMTNIATTLYTESKIAKQAFSQFPSGEQPFEKVNKFLSQVGNYPIFLAQKVISGSDITEEERNNLYKLSEISKEISATIGNLEQEYNTEGYWENNMGNKIAESIDQEGLSASFLELEETLTDYPTLIYDGPYSDYISPDGYQLLNEAQPVTEEYAKEVAAKVLGINSSILKTETQDNGKIVSYNFDYGSGAISISINGGYVVYFRKYNVEANAVLTYEQAIEKAVKFLSQENSLVFTPTYYYDENGVCVVNFAAKNGNTTCYTDLVKIGVDMANGDIVFYEGRGFLTNYKTRTLKTPEYSVEQAREIISDSLTVKSEALVLIPTDAGYEKHCYEFTCTGRHDEEILLYINVETLEEEEILMLIRTNGGILTK